MADNEHREPVVLAWSGGKDSAMALHALRAAPGVEVTALLLTLTSGYDRSSMLYSKGALLVPEKLLERCLEFLRGEYGREHARPPGSRR